MEGAAAAIGIIATGVTVTTNFLAYYDRWKHYKTEIETAYKSIFGLRATLELLRSSLSAGKLEPETLNRIGACLQECNDNFAELENMLERFEKDHKRSWSRRLKDRTWAELQRIVSALHDDNLERVRYIAARLMLQLSATYNIVILDKNVESEKLLLRIEQYAKATSTQVSHIEDTFVNVSGQIQEISGAVKNLGLQNNDEKLRDCLRQLAPPDPWVNHREARVRHEKGTGTWLLESEQYKKWKLGETRSLWLHGKPGCGKTVLCSTVIEDIRQLCEKSSNLGFSFFYLSFAEKSKQSLDDLLRSLLAQTCHNGQTRSRLIQEYEQAKPNALDPRLYEDIILQAIKKYDKFYLLLDALDESPEDNDCRTRVLDFMQRLLAAASNVQMLSTGRTLQQIQACMNSLDAQLISFDTKYVNDDIAAYVTKEIQRHTSLSQFDAKTRDLIDATFAQNADGMFRWAYCQLQELKKLKSFRHSHIQRALKDMPATLDGTYERLLLGLDPNYAEEALRGLRWLAFSEEPLSLKELAEGCLINPASEITVDYDDRSDPRDLLNILSGLVSVEEWEAEESYDPHRELQVVRHSWLRPSSSRESPRVRLAHFTVKEYLTSTRLENGKASFFYLQEPREHTTLTHACIAYLQSYSDRKRRGPCERIGCEVKDFRAYPFLAYATTQWWKHAQKWDANDVVFETDFLISPDYAGDWIGLAKLLQCLNFVGVADHTLYEARTGLCYACLFGLTSIVAELLARGVDPSGQQSCRTPLQDAMAVNELGIAQMLLDAGADVNVRGAFTRSLLEIAITDRHPESMNVIVEQNADLNADYTKYGTPLQAALSLSRRAELSSGINASDLVAKLIDRGADVNTFAGLEGNALKAAIMGPHWKLARLLIQRGANVNAVGGIHGTALQAAASRCCESLEAVKLLLELGADPNIQLEPWSTALGAASRMGHLDVVELLIDHGADVNSSGGYATPIIEATLRQRGHIVAFLLKQGANVNALSDEFGTALHAATLRHGQSISLTEFPNTRETHSEYHHSNNIHGTFSPIASRLDNPEDVRLFVVLRGADDEGHVHVGTRDTALDFAGTPDKDLQIMKLLIEQGADVNLRCKRGFTPLEVAVDSWRAVPAADLLIAYGAVITEEGKQQLGLNRKRYNEELINKQGRLVDIKNASDWLW